MRAKQFCALTTSKMQLPQPPVAWAAVRSKDVFFVVVDLLFVVFPIGVCLLCITLCSF